MPLSRLLYEEERAGAKRPATNAKAGLRGSLNLVAKVMERAGKAQAAWDSIRTWNSLEPQYQKRLTQAFPHGPHEMLDLMTDGEGDVAGIKFTPQSMEVHLKDDEGVFKHLDREFYFRLGLLELRHLEIDPAFRNAGLGIRILTGTRNVAAALGMKHMELTAEEAGTYVWARAGFLPDGASWDSLRQCLTDDLKQGWADVPQKVKQDLLKILKDAKPHALWQFVDYKYEHHADEKLVVSMLAGYAWRGFFDLKSASQNKRLKAYAKAREA